MYYPAQTFHENLLQFYLEKLATPSGIGLVAAGLVAASLVVAFDRFKWVVLTLAIFLGSLSYTRAVILPLGPGLVPEPFRTLSALSQPLTFGAILLLLIAALKPVPWHRARLMHPALLLLLLLQMVLSFRQVTGGYLERGITGFLVYGLLFLVMGVGVSRWLHDESQIRSLSRSISWLAVLICASCVAVLLLEWDAAFAGERLTGALDNPQRLASLLAISVPFSLLLGTDPGNSARSRTFHLIVAGVATVFLMWTSSRAGGLALVAGGAVFFRRRLGWGVLSLLAAGGIVLVLLSMTESNISGSTALMFRTNNSRAEVWAAALEHFYRSPIVGVPADIAVVESSYISVAAASGIVGLIPLGLMLLALGVTCYRLSLRRKTLGAYKPAVDLVLAVTAQFIVLWTFDGYLVGLVTNAMLVLYCLLAVSTLLLERAAEVEHQGPSMLPQDDDYQAHYPADTGFVHAG